MPNKDLETIKENMVERAMELWEIEDRALMDPVVELLLDVFAHEFSKINQDLKISDSKLVERIAKILVKESWYMPLPAHALIRMEPVDDYLWIDKENHFYYQKVLDGNESLDIFFTSLTSFQIIKARAICTIKNKGIAFFDERGRTFRTIPQKPDGQIWGHTLWVGIEIDRKLLEKTDELSISIMPRDSDLAPYLRMTKVFNTEDDLVPIRPQYSNKNTGNTHYYNSVFRYYQDYLYTLDITKCNALQTLPSKCKEAFHQEDLEDMDQELLWLKFQFPAVFDQEELRKLQISLNTFPVVNRKLKYKQHNVKRNGRIVSISSPNEHFLNVAKMEDDKGREFHPTLNSEISNLEGSYSLYFGELEQFDERNAKQLLEQVIQKVREEGSAFSAIGYDILNAHLEDLNKKLDVLERKLSLGQNNHSTGGKQYIMSFPYKDTSNLECHYWITDAHEANGLPQGTKLAQYKLGGIVPNTIRLWTDTIGGRYKNSTKEQVANLRYGLISKDRIVSREDIKEFVKTIIGKSVINVEVSSGVSVSPNKKEGLVRTTEVHINMRTNTPLSPENQKRLAHYIQSELEHKSVHNIPYKVTICLQQ